MAYHNLVHFLPVALAAAGIGDDDRDDGAIEDCKHGGDCHHRHHPHKRLAPGPRGEGACARMGLFLFPKAVNRVRHRLARSLLPVFAQEGSSLKPPTG